MTLPGGCDVKPMKQGISRVGMPAEVVFPSRHCESTPASVRHDKAHVLKIGSVVKQVREGESLHSLGYSPRTN